jgi:hypothetical protein
MSRYLGTINKFLNLLQQKVSVKIKAIDAYHINIECEQFAVQKLLNL